MAETSKVDCRRKSAVDSIINALNESMENIISRNSESSDEEKEKCRARFREIYQTAMQQNVLIDGREWTHVESMDEITDFNHCDADSYNGLVSKLNSAIMCLSKERRCYPRLCEEEMYKIINKKVYYLAKVEVVTQGIQPPIICDAPVLMEDLNLNYKLKGSSLELHSLSKSATLSLERARRLNTAVTILNQPTKTDQVISMCLMDDHLNDCNLNSTTTTTSER